MKKWMAALIAAAMCLSAVAGACAEVVLTPYAEVEDADFISDSDLLRVQKRTGYALASADGTLLTEAVYSSMGYYYGWVTTAKRSDDAVWTNGLLSAEGAEVMPFEYADVNVLSPYWAVGVKVVEATKDNYDYTSWTSDDVYLIDTADIYWLPGAERVASIPREHYSGARAYGEVINVEDRATGKATAYDAGFNALGEVSGLYSEDYAPTYATFSENGQQGLKDPDGSVVMAPAYRYVYTDVRDGYFQISTGDKYGLADLTGAVAVPAEYDRINSGYYAPYTGGSAPYVIEGYVCVERDGKLGYVRVGGGESCEPKYARDNLDNYGVSAKFTDMSGKVNILAADGVETAVEGDYTRVDPLSYGSGRYYTVTDADYHRGLIDWHGVEILPCAYETIELSGSGRYLLTKEDYSSPAVIREIAYADDDAAEPAQDGAADEPAAEGAPASGSAAARSILESAAAIVGSDGASAASLLENAKVLLGENSQAGAVISSAVTLLNVDAAGNADAVAALIRTALDMIGE